MKLTLSFATILVTLTTVVAASPELKAAPVPKGHLLQARAYNFGRDTDEKKTKKCKKSGCDCNGYEGEFCGNENVNPDCHWNHVYKCHKSGKAEDCGERSSCKKCGDITCAGEVPDPDDDW